MIARVATALLLTLAACAPSVPTVAVDRLATPTIALPPMKTFGAGHAGAPTRSNADIAQDFMDLTFRLESGRALPVFSRFEGPVTIRATGARSPSLSADLDRLVARIRSEAGIDLRRVDHNSAASITVQAVPTADLHAAVPHAACFVVPRIASWDEFRRYRNSARVDWTTLVTRQSMAVFVPSDAAPQEIRDCLHEEVAQALGPLNDLYRLTDSVFNDDNFHTVLTGFDMMVLRATYAPELRPGMTPAEVGQRVPGIIARLNPGGRGGAKTVRPATPRAWIDAIETALGPRIAKGRRLNAAREAVSIARTQGWHDNRLGFSLCALGRLSLASTPDLALSSFLAARQIFAAAPETAIHEAHVSMQLAAFALSTGQAAAAVEIANDNLATARAGENAALLASLLMIKAEALDLLGHSADARAVRRESLGWARYGFGSDAAVRQRANEFAALNPMNRQEPQS